MRIAIAQINSSLGDFAGNRKKIIEYCKKAADKRCEIVVFPESSLFGYYQMDLLERESIVDEQLKELDMIENQIPENLLVIVGAITRNPKMNGKAFHNSAVLLEKGKKRKIFAKELLPTYDVFDEARHIEPGRLDKNFFKFKGKNFLVTICEDIWAWSLKRTGKSNYEVNPIKKLKSSQVDYIINLSGSPFTEVKAKDRLDVIRQTVNHLKAPMVYVNMVGAQDELIFDGGSVAVNKKGEVVCNCVQFEEDINVIDFDKNEGGLRQQSLEPMEAFRQALVLGIRDFVEKTELKSVHVGLSGGVDSALVACLATDALGPSRVTAIAMPGKFSSDESVALARQLSKNLGIELFEIPIVDLYESTLSLINSVFGEQEFGVMHENIQARLRSMLLMSYSNKEGSLLLNTSNKSELATGYSTLYGDLCGGLSPIGDLLKTEVVQLCQLYNKEYELIPKRIIERPPSAELRPNQKDTDTLPEYKILDRAVENLVEKCGKPKGSVEKWLLNAMMKSEFKRWQAPPVLKVTDHSFGRGRRLPIAHKAIF